MDRLVLFDIDCTLVDPHGVGGRAMFGAIAETFGVLGELDGYTFHGRTDPAIIVDLATRWGIAPGDAEEGLWPCLDRYVELLRAEVGEAQIEVLPGVPELVAALAADESVLLGLLTGNIAAGARIKLAPTGIGDLFRVGAYGDDARWRPELPAIAVRRAAELTGRGFAGKEIVIIGDTPADVACGASLGVKAIAVATGIHTIDDLAACRPDHVFASLGDWRAVRDAIVS